MNKLIKKISIAANLELITGLHIGGSKESIDIGGVDNPVIRRTIDNVPYIPGSSIKGKLRSLLEQIAGAAKVGDNKEINNLFGYAKNDLPSKIIVRDAYMSEESQQLLHYSDFTDMPYTEIKFENTIDRIKGKADHPRQIERVPAGAIFKAEFIINVWQNEDGTTNEKSAVEMLRKGMKAIENDYLGGNGSRGYGQILFKDVKEEVIVLDAKND